MKIFDNTEESDFLKFVKKVFHIESDISKIFLQDSEGNLLLLPKIIPEGLNVHLYIEPEFKQKVENIKVDNSLLPGFKWDDTISLYDGKAKVSNDGYFLGRPEQNSGWTPVASTTEYSSGKLFCKINAEIHAYQALGVCSINYDGKKLHWDNSLVTAFDMSEYFQEMVEDGFVHSMAFLLNMNTKNFSFYELKDDKYVKKLSLSFP